MLHSKTIRAGSWHKPVARLVALTGIVASAATTASAAGVDPASIFTLSGFGTLGLTHSSLDTADFVSTAFEPNGAGHDHKYDFTGDSKLGVQLDARLTDKLSAVVQVVSQHRYDNSFKPTLEWANVKYAFTPDLSLRVGRIELPIFLDSDYRNVGYANLWVRAPGEIYNTEPITNSDGADISWRVRVGQISNTVRMLYGTTSFHINPGALKAEGTGIFGVFDTVEYHDLTVRAGYLRSEVKLSFLDKQPVRLASVAASYDTGRWFLQGEFARITVDAFTPGYLAGYVTAACRIGKFTPYVTYAQEKSLDRGTVTPNYDRGQKDLSSGVRWDFAKNVDLKLQYDHVWTPTGSAGQFMAEQPDFRLGSGTNVFSAVLDFVF
jgi:hypothetical protein